MKKRKFSIKNRYVALALTLSAVVVVYILLTHIRTVISVISKLISYISPLIWGIAIAYILWPIVAFIENKLLFKLKKQTVRRGLSLFITIIIVLGFLSFLAFLLIPNIIASVEALSDNINTYITSAKDFITDLEKSFAERGINLKFEELFGSWDNALKAVISWLPQNIESLAGTFYEIGTGLFNALIVFVIAIYLLADKERMIRYAKTLEEAIFPGSWRAKLDHFLAECDRIFSRYIGTNFLDALIVGVASLIFLLIFDMPYAALISVVAALCNMIPTFGPIVALVFSGLLLVFYNPWYALWYLVFAIIVQAIDAYFIKPKLFGGSLGLPAVITLTSIIIFGRIFGLLGVLLGVPLAAILYYLIQHFVRIGLKKHRKTKPTSAAQEPATDKAATAEPDALIETKEE